MFKNLLLLFFAGVIPLIIYIMPVLGLNELIYKLDVHSPFWIFSLLFGFSILLFVKLFKDFCKWLHEICSSGKGSFIAIIIIVLIYVIFSLCFIEGRSRTQADESIYLVTAQNLYHNQAGMHCMVGSFIGGNFNCNLINESVKARGLSYLYMLGMPFFGTNLYWVYNFHTFLLLLALPIFFLAIKAWTKNDLLSILSTVLLASVPVLLFQFRSASVESLYVFMFALSLLFLKWAYDRNTTRHWLLLALTLAFFAQTRTETVLCLFAFIGVVFYRICLNQIPILKIYRIFKLQTLNSQFSFFLATLSFFCIPVLCTISLGRKSDLQGGSYGAHWHLFSNIVDDFKIMAFFHHTSDSLLRYPFLPYFTWLALFGLITLIILTIKELKNKEGNFPIPYKYISTFILLLSPQYLILFDGVSADFNLQIQQRFALIILPVMSFFGALFLQQIGLILKKIKLFRSVNHLIWKSGIIAIILTYTLVHHESFKQNIMYRYNVATFEDTTIKHWLNQMPTKPRLFFYYNTTLILSNGVSAYSLSSMFDFDSLDVQKMLKEYDGEVYAIYGSGCRNNTSVPKMIAPGAGSICSRFDVYFDSEQVFDTSLVGIKVLSISRITGLKDRDPQNLLRLFNMGSKDSLFLLHYSLLKKDSQPWKVQRFVNDSLIIENPYIYGKYTDQYKLDLLKIDTNKIDVRIIDTLAGDTTVHSDYWRFLRTY